MSDNRKKILVLLDNKKISVEEAMRLLQAVESGDKSSEVTGGVGELAKKVGNRIKYLRVIVENPKGNSMEDPERVNVRVPVSLIRAGMKFTSLIPQEAAAQVEGALKQKGINLNVKNIKDEDIDELIEALAELEVDVDGGDGKVRVFAE
ncbi:MAG: SHOCT-like domain-containing protein [Dehalogenimonas sp.]